MKKNMDFTAHFDFNGDRYAIRTASDGDMETLRLWKNANAPYFHHKAPITPEQQSAWFAAFKAKPDQQMFVCEGPRGLVACVGFRGQGHLELFNLICGDSTLLGTGFNAAFFATVRENLVAGGTSTIHLEVLKSNKRGVAWYLKQGFKYVGEKGDAHLLELSLQR